MTENLLQKLEEKMMVLLTEIEDLRDKVTRLSQENASLKADKDSYQARFETKLKDLISLFDTVVEPTVVNANFAGLKPAAVVEA